MAAVQPLAATSFPIVTNTHVTNMHNTSYNASEFSNVHGEAMPLVSVIMPVYNGEKYLAEAMESILAQTFTDFEFLIVDDGSTDDSAEIIQSYEERDNRIRFFQQVRNMGKADARNCGIAAAKGEYITGMDCDDVSLPERLQKQVDFLQSHPDIGALGTCGKVVNHDMTTLLYYFEVQRQHALIALDLFLDYGFLPATVMLRREFLSAVGGYEPGRRAVEDLELLSRLLHETRIKFSNLPENLLLYRRHEQLKFHNRATRVAIQAKGRELKRRMLEQLWNEAPEATLDHLYCLRMRSKLSWAERRSVKQDILRLIESMIAHNWVEPEDRPLLINEMNRRLEQASPRLWQQFSHWWRHHFQL